MTQHNYSWGGVEAATSYMVVLHISCDFDKFNGVYASYFDEIIPARTTVQSVLGENIKVEIDIVFSLPQ